MLEEDTGLLLLNYSELLCVNTDRTFTFFLVLLVCVTKTSIKEEIIPLVQIHDRIKSGTLSRYTRIYELLGSYLSGMYPVNIYYDVYVMYPVTSPTTSHGGVLEEVPVQ